MLIPEPYRRLEKERGRALTGIGVAGVAFTREDILEALACLKGSQVAVLGRDVLEIVNGKPRYTHDSWYANREPEEDLMGYLERSIAEAEQYIRRFPDPQDGTILYSPVLSELGVIGGPRN
jgi:Immunity protein 40